MVVASIALLTAGTMHAGGMGLVCGLLHVIGPDHIATLVSFSTLLAPWAAAKVGAAWGLGHCAGIFGMALVVYLLGSLPGIHFEAWEKNGDYIIGCSMILVAIYFILQESQYLAVDSDGHVVVAGCGCHRPSEENHPPSCKHNHEHGHANHAEEGNQECTEATPLVAHVHHAHDLQGRDAKGAFVGFVQGMCCPMGLVQLTYLAGRSALETLVFSVMTVLVAVTGTAALAACWAALTRSDLLKSLSPRVMYRASCGATLALGVAWIAANYYDVLDKLNYAEGGEHASMV